MSSSLAARGLESHRGVNLVRFYARRIESMDGKALGIDGCPWVGGWSDSV